MIDKLGNINNKVCKEKALKYLSFVTEESEDFTYYNNISELNLVSKVYLDILNDTSLVKPLHYDCTGFVSPLDYQEINNSHLSEFCLLYNFDKSFNNEDMIDEGLEVYLKDLLESNINSK